MIGADQFRAARAYLGWSQDDLATATGLSATTIRNLESDAMSPRSTTMNVIRRALESAGIEFIDGGGVRRKNIDVKIFDGHNSVEEFFAHLNQTVSNRGGEIIAVLRSADMLARFHTVSAARHEWLERLSRHAPVKCLLPEIVDPALATETIQFRAIPRQHIGPASYFVYGDKHAIILTNGVSLRFLVFTSASVAEDYRAHFLTLWGMAPPVYRERRQSGRAAAV